jgi:phage/plasmid-associated DNA primase
MRGFPKNIATKQDVMNLKDKYPKETKKFLEWLLKTNDKHLIENSLGYPSVKEAQLVLDEIKEKIDNPPKKSIFNLL